MQDVNLQNLISAVAKSSGNATAANTTAGALLSPLPVVNITQTGQATTIRALQNQAVVKLLSSPQLTTQNVTAAVSNDSQQLAVFSQPKTLFNALLNAQQFSTLLASLAQQPGIGKILQASERPVTTQSATIIAISGNSVTVKLDNPAVTAEPIRIPVGDLAKQLSVGQAVTIQIRQVAGQWQANLIATPIPAPNSDVVKSGAKAQQAPVVPTVSSATESKTTAEPSTSSAARSIPITAQPVSLPTTSPLPAGIIAQQLQQGFTVNNLLNSIKSLEPLVPKEVLTLLRDGIRTAGIKSDINITDNRQLQISATLPLTKLALTNETPEVRAQLNQALGKLPAGYERIAAPFFKLTTSQQQQFVSALERLPIAKPVGPSEPLATGNLKSPLPDETVTLNSPQPASSRVTPANSTPVRVDIPEKLAQQITQLTKNAFVSSESATINRQSLDAMLTAMVKSPDMPLKQLGEQLRQAVLPLVTRQPDPTQIQQLLQMPALPVTTQSIAQAQPTNSMVNGLVALFQLSLATRFNRGETSATGQDKLTQIMNTIVALNTPTGNKTNTTRIPPRSSTEFGQLEQRHQLLRSLTRILNGHQFSKLNQAESASQGQETLFYALPSLTNQAQRDIELLIRREPDEKSSTENDKGARHIWHLTMLLSAGDAGDVLAKCRLQEDELGLDLYTSTDELRIQVLEHLSQLKKRLAKFGLDVVSSQCQLGVIPDSLKPKPYQLLNTQA